MLSLALLIVAFILALLAGFNVPAPRASWIALALAFFFASLLAEKL